MSIRQMIERAASDHGVDRSRIFVTGLSAGGAMTSVMLAAYPEVFAGGAIVAGLPYRSAGSVKEAFTSMFQSPPRPAREWGDLVRAASPHRGPWPKVSVWHGSTDATVVPLNAKEIVKQWTDVHGLPQRPTSSDTVDGYPHSVWRDADGKELIESYTITGMAHGTPLATGDGEGRFGVEGPFLLEVGISSSYHIARFWGLTGAAAPAAAGMRKPDPATAILLPSLVEPTPGAEPPAPPRPASERPTAERPAGAVEIDGSAHRAEAERGRHGQHGKEHGKERGLDIGAIISNALRTAGLIKD